jgi:hypothetical protein
MPLTDDERGKLRHERDNVERRRKVRRMSYEALEYWLLGGQWIEVWLRESKDFFDGGEGAREPFVGSSWDWRDEAVFEDDDKEDGVEGKDRAAGGNGAKAVSLVKTAFGRASVDERMHLQDGVLL